MSEEEGEPVSLDLYPIGEVPPLGEVPAQMYASVIRPERFNQDQPKEAFKIEAVAVPEIGPSEVLVVVMAAGVNYNNVWAARGIPFNVVKAHERRGDDSGFHIGGSDASGIVYKVGEAVYDLKVGDRVVISCGMWDPNDPDLVPGGDPMFASSFRIWGFGSNFGSFAQFTKVQSHQCMPKATHLTWEEAAAPTLVGATAYRMLTNWPPNEVKEGNVVLVWGGAGGLGTMAIQIVSHFGGVPIAVVSSEERGEYCMTLGAKGFINRKSSKFTHWGRMPDWDSSEYGKWVRGVAAFNGELQRIVQGVVGERRPPRIVFEHSAQDTIPTSIVVVEEGGMVVICAGTSGYNLDVDARYLWDFQKRLQGSHFANGEQAIAFNQLVVDGEIQPCLGQVFDFEQVGDAHQLMYKGRHQPGKMVILVGADREGMGREG